MRRHLGIGLAAALATAHCANPPATATSQTTQPSYDKKTGRLTQLTFDRNGNGVIDTWTEMDGARPLRSRIDANEDGRPDRVEDYDASGRLLKVGVSRKDDGKPDAWAFSGADGSVERVEVSSTADERAIDRWEFYKGTELVRVEADTNGDGRPDSWETYEGGVLKTAASDENGDGRPDRRLTYEDGALVLIESEPDASGHFAKRLAVK